MFEERERPLAHSDWSKKLLLVDYPIGTVTLSRLSLSCLHHFTPRVVRSSNLETALEKMNDLLGRSLDRPLGPCCNAPRQEAPDMQVGGCVKVGTRTTRMERKLKR